MINKTPASANVPAFTPSVHVAPDGRVSVTYYDFRELSLSNNTTLPTDYWILNCLPSASDCTKAANWTEQQLAGPFDMKLAPVARGFFVGDYEGLGAAATTAGTVFDPAWLSAALLEPSVLLHYGSLSHHFSADSWRHRLIQVGLVGLSLRFGVTK